MACRERKGQSMCYSAQIWADYRKYVHHWGADVDIKEFVRIYWHRQQQPSIRIPKKWTRRSRIRSPMTSARSNA